MSIINSILLIKGLRVSVKGQEILHGIDLEIPRGEIHVLMGPNGSGKSTLVNTLMGHPALEAVSGTVLYNGENLLGMKPHERARKGLFLAFQYPREISGISLRSFLFAAYKARMSYRHPDGRGISPITFHALLGQKMDLIGMDHGFADRPVNEGFSGGEKKKAEILQMLTLDPDFALLDETDSGLDIDALKVVAEGINAIRRGERSLVTGHSSPINVEKRATNNDQPAAFSGLIVTHYARILDYVKPDRVHVMVGGKIIRSGGLELALSLEREGYKLKMTIGLTQK